MGPVRSLCSSAIASFRSGYCFARARGTPRTGRVTAVAWSIRKCTRGVPYFVLPQPLVADVFRSYSSFGVVAHLFCIGSVRCVCGSVLGGLDTVRVYEILVVADIFVRQACRSKVHYALFCGRGIGKHERILFSNTTALTPASAVLCENLGACDKTSLSARCVSQ